MAPRTQRQVQELPTREERLGLLDEPVERVVKHGVFWYNVPEHTVLGGESKEILVEHLGFHGDIITIQRAADLERGEKHDAFFTDEELKTVRLPQLEQRRALEAAGEEDEPVNAHDLDDEELGDWLTGTGAFDGHEPPTVEEVRDEVGDDQELAERVLEIEKRTQNRTTLVEPLQTLVDKE